MWKKVTICLYAGLLWAVANSYGQTDSAQAIGTTSMVAIPDKFLRKMQRSMAAMDQRLTRRSEKLLANLSKQEDHMRKRLAGTDSVGAQQLFGASSEKYAALRRQLLRDTGGVPVPMSGEYLPYIDSLQGALSFLHQHPGLAKSGPAQATLTQMQALQAKLRDADQIKAYIREQRQQIGDYVRQHTGAVKLLGSPYQNMNKAFFYYSQEMQQYKEMLNNPDALARQALKLLNELPAFQTFMKNNSQLAGLFNVPGNYGSQESLAGLQTRDQVSALIQNQAGGAGGQAALASSVDAGRSQLDGYKDKLDKLAGGGEIDMPDFTPNNQKTRSLWRRLEYGANLQTTKNNSFVPSISDLGLSVGYKINDKSVIGIGASYKLGWGNGINAIHLSSRGVGLRSFVDMKLKGSIFVSGGLELNYIQPFASVQQLQMIDQWSRSGLIGLSKIVSMKSRAFKKTKVQLLWDFLSYQQVPQTQAILFRVAYVWR